jgi:hypothetical protein
MKFPRNANAPGDRPKALAAINFEGSASRSRSPNQFKPHFLAARASVQLASVLDPNVPDCTALALSANLALFLRKSGIQPGQIIFQPGEGEETE